MEQKNPKKQQKIAKSLGNYARYSNMAFQMAAIIGICVFGGIKLDHWLKLNFPVFTLILSLIGIGTAIYFVIKDFLKKK